MIALSHILLIPPLTSSHNIQTMKKLKRQSEGDFRQFVDQTSPEQAAQVERNWRKKTKQEKNKLFTRILIAATIVIAIIFVVTLNLFINNPKSHTILDQDRDGYTLVQTTFPHIVAMIDNQIQTYETKMVRSGGIVYGELIAWIEANLVSNNKVLYIPNQKSGTTLLGMALGYYLSPSRGGSLDVLVQPDSYRQYLTKNAQHMNNFKAQKIVFNFLNSLDQLQNDYHLLVVENNDNLKSLQLNKFKRIVQIKKKKWDNIAISNYMKTSIKYEIAKGKFNSQTLALGQFKSYSLIQLRESMREQYKTILILNKQQPNFNLCPEKIEFFQTSSEKRNLLQYFRNKTLGTDQRLFFCLNDTQTFKSIAQLDNIGDSLINGNNALEAIRQQKYPYSAQVKHTFVLSWSDFKQFNTKLKGEILIFISTQQEATQAPTFLNNNSLKMISPLNNNGCLFPASHVTYKVLKPFHPFFLVLNQN